MIFKLLLCTHKRENMAKKKKKADLLWKEFSIVLRISFANLYFELIRGEKKKRVKYKNCRVRKKEKNIIIIIIIIIITKLLLYNTIFLLNFLT